MSEIKTKITKINPDDYIKQIKDNKKEDFLKIYNLIKTTTKEKPLMFGENMIGFGKYHYKSKSGSEGDWFKTGIAIRKAHISVYVSFYLEEIEDKLKDLGKAKYQKSCINIKKVEDINLEMLKEIIEISNKRTLYD